MPKYVFTESEMVRRTRVHAIEAADLDDAYRRYNAGAYLERSVWIPGERLGTDLKVYEVTPDQIIKPVGD